MNLQFISNLRGRSTDYSRNGFTLIEFIGVLAVMSFLGLMLTQTVIKRTDYAAATTEQASLATLTNALKLQVLRGNNIPSQASWVNAMTNWLPYPATSISTNARGNARAYLIDTSGWLSSGGYTQTAAGTASAPANARVMFVSSIGRALPSGLLSSTPISAPDFNNLWNSTAGTIPNGGVWSSWPGNPGDVVVQRFNLQPLFYQLVLINRDATANATFAINYSTTSVVPNGTPLNAYYLAGTVVDLDSSAVLQTRYLLGQNTSCAYEYGVWGGQIAYTTNAIYDTNILGTVFNSAAKAFYAAAINKGATNGSGLGSDQSAVLSSFSDLMATYTTWANDGFPNYSVGGAQNHLPVWILLQNAQGYVHDYAGNDSKTGLLRPYP